jgi:hypothetical protein
VYATLLGRGGCSDRADARLLAAGASQTSTVNRLIPARVWLAIVLSLLAIGALALPVGGASAATFHEYTTSFGPDGTPDTDFAQSGPIAVDPTTDAVYVGEPSSGSIVKFDAAGQPSDFASTPGSNEIKGLTIFAFDESELAVGPTNHDIYTIDPSTIRAFKANGEADKFTAGPNPGTNQVGGFGYLLGVATDVNGYLYAADWGSGTVSVLAPNGEFLTSFEMSEAGSVAVRSDGTVYVNHYFGATEKYVPSSFPVTASTTYSAAGVVYAPDFAPTMLAINPATGNLLINNANVVREFNAAGAIDEEFANSGPGKVEGSAGIAANGAGDAYVGGASGTAVAIFAAKTVPDITTDGVPDGDSTLVTLRGQVAPDGGGGISDCHFEYGPDTKYSSGSIPCSPATSFDDATAVSASISGLPALGQYHFRLVATGVGGTGRGRDRTFIVRPFSPVIESTSVSQVTETDALFETQINPGFGPTVFRIQYGPTADYGQQTYPSPVGSDGSTHAASTTVSELAPTTVYHYRTVATNFRGTVLGPDQTFRTLPDPPKGAPTPPAAVQAPAPPAAHSAPKCKKNSTRKKGKCVKKKKKHRKGSTHKRGSKHA